MSYSNEFHPTAYEAISSIISRITPFEGKSGKVFEFSFPSFSQAKKARSLLYDWRSHHRIGRASPFQIRESFSPIPGFTVVFRISLTATLESAGRSLEKTSDLKLLTELTQNLLQEKNPFAFLAPLFLEGTITLKEGIFVLQELLRATGQDNPFTPSKEEVREVALTAGRKMGLKPPEEPKEFEETEEGSILQAVLEAGKRMGLSSPGEEGKEKEDVQ